MSVAESQRFPDLPSIGRIARERAADAVSRALSDVAHADETSIFPAFAPDRLAATTQFFLDLVVARPLLRAVFGESRKRLRAEIAAHVTRSVAFFLAACRQGG